MKRRFLWTAGVLVLGIAVMLFWPRKSVSVNDSDLQPVRSFVPDSENAFSTLERARRRLTPEGFQRNSVDALFSAKQHDPDKIKEVLREYSEELELFNEARRFANLQVPEPKNFDDDNSFLGGWKTLAQLRALQAEDLVRQKKDKEALRITLDIVRFGEQAESSGGVTIHYLVGVAVKGIGLQTLRTIAWEPDVDCEALQEINRTLSSLGANETALTNVIKTEYKLQASVVDKTRAGYAMGTGNPTSVEKTAVSLLSRPLLDVNATKLTMGRFAREQLAAIPKHWSDVPTNSFSRSTNGAEMLLSGNAMGELLQSIMLPAQEKFLVRKCRENVEVSATRLAIALKCYQAKHGKLPPSLEDLVPEFIEKVPADDFDGKPFRYSAEKGIIYSVGDDLIDSGGLEKDSHNQRLDLVFRLQPFQPPPLRKK